MAAADGGGGQGLLRKRLGGGFLYVKLNFLATLKHLCNLSSFAMSDHLKLSRHLKTLL